MNNERTDWLHADWLRDQLDAMQLPAELLRHISFRDSSLPDPLRGPSYIQYPPPWPGCCTPPGMGSARIWGEFCVRECIELAAWAFYPDITPQRAAVLDAAASTLRRAGEGSRTMWALDLIHPGAHGWLDHPLPAFTVSDLVQWGPRLSRQLVADIDAMLIDVGLIGGAVFGRPDPDPNSETTFHGVRCYETTWMAGCGPLPHGLIAPA